MEMVLRVLASDAMLVIGIVMFVAGGLIMAVSQIVK